MKSSKKLIAVLLALFTVSVSKTFAQYSQARITAMYTFSPDSLIGFDEQSASIAAANNACFGQEYRYFMYNEKRKFINERYNVQTLRVMQSNASSALTYPARYVYTPNTSGNRSAAPLVSSGACSNEDFENAQANPGAQIGGVVGGWVILGENTGATYCNPVVLNATNLYTVYNAPFTDPLMLFPTNVVSSYFDATSLAQPAGNCFIRLNDGNAGAKMVKATKTYTIQPSNAVFRYAYRAVLANPGHVCCNQPGVQIKVTITNTVTQASTLLACPQVSIAAGNACTVAAPGFVNGGTQGGSPVAYNPAWVPASIDLSPYIGSEVKLDIYAIDCSQSGHTGYVYIDALCQPMVIGGNGQGFPAGTPSITLPTCGAAGATVTAPPGLGPYTWTSSAISIPANLTVPNVTNTALTTIQSGTLMLTMSPPGGCAPITKLITVSVTPAPILLASATQPGCTNTLSAASVTTAGSASPSATITWSPVPGALAGNSLSATGVPVGITTITATDPLGCKVTATIQINAAPPPVTFTINNLTGSPSITCINPTVVLQAVSNYTYGTISYTWSSPSFTATGATVSITAANSLTLTGIDLATGCQFQQTVAIGIFTTQPTNSVNPVSQAITCATTIPVTFSGTCTNPTINLQHDWYSPLNPLPGGVPIATSNNTISILSGVIPPGVYTLVTTNLVNGCKAFKTVTVTSLDAWPTFGINSTTNFSVGCSPLNTTTLSITNAVSTQTPPSTCSFTFLPPGFGGTLAIGPYSGNNSTITTIPGTWTVIVNDNSNNCKTMLSVPIIQNTVAPHVAVTTMSPSMSQILTCYNPTLLATGTSTTPNAQINWLKPIAPPLVSTSTLVLGPPNGPNTSTTSLTYANFTVVSTNTVNACVTTSVVVISQNFKPPVSSPTISIGTPTAIYCTAGTNPVVLTTGASTTTSGMGPSAFPLPVLWEGPSPQGTTTGVSSYSCYVPGVYTLTIMDNANGCTRAGTINVLDRTQPPVITNPVATASLDCGSNSATLSLALTGTTTGGIRYLVDEYPAAAAFTPTNASISNINPLLSGTSASIILVSKVGTYEYVVSNTLTGCQAAGTVNVVPGDLTANFDADTYAGYAPLTVNFTNISGSSLNSLSVTSVWSFGNGTSSVTTVVTDQTHVTYNAPGTYTVMLLASKGSCLDTVWKTIRIDIPSKLEVPNIFTPNGDGSNDVFFLKTANLSDITASIFDRWGNKVYETDSSTGNIAWDGKNPQGKECPSGVYFYTIKASGKDGTSYNTKGNVTLVK